MSKLWILELVEIPSFVHPIIVQGDQTEWGWSLIFSDNITTGTAAGWLMCPSPVTIYNLLNHKIPVVNSPIFALCNKARTGRFKRMKGLSNHQLKIPNSVEIILLPRKREQISFLCKAFFIAGFCRMQEGRKIYLLSLNDKNKQNNL